MNFEEAQNKLAKYGQEHVLKYFNELNREQKENLLAQIDGTDFSVISKITDNIKKIHMVLYPQLKQ